MLYICSVGKLHYAPKYGLAFITAAYDAFDLFYRVALHKPPISTIKSGRVTTTISSIKVVSKALMLCKPPIPKDTKACLSLPFSCWRLLPQSQHRYTALRAAFLCLEPLEQSHYSHLLSLIYILLKCESGRPETLFHSPPPQFYLKYFLRPYARLY